MNKYKYGKNPKRHDNRTAQFKDFKTIDLVLPTTIDHTEGIVDWGMMLNDQIGDCAIAAPGHAIMEWTKPTQEVVPTDEQILEAYSEISGYNPKTGANDNGCNMLDVLNHWRNTGIAGHKIGAFVEVDIKNVNEIREALYLFHGIYVGVNLPDSAMKQFEENVPWTVVKRSKIDGGHAILLVFSDANLYKFVTWGKTQPANLAWVLKYMDEAYAIISQDYFNGTKTAEGYDIPALTAYLKQVTK
jgi:hypothetical protein